MRTVTFGLRLSEQQEDKLRNYLSNSAIPIVAQTVNRTDTYEICEPININDPTLWFRCQAEDPHGAFIEGAYHFEGSDTLTSIEQIGIASPQFEFASTNASFAMMEGQLGEGTDEQMSYMLLVRMEEKES